MMLADAAPEEAAAFWMVKNCVSEAASGDRASQTLHVQ
jgi:hypothetical protein